jgi:hypothetical protein
LKATVCERNWNEGEHQNGEGGDEESYESKTIGRGQAAAPNEPGDHAGKSRETDRNFRNRE